MQVDDIRLSFGLHDARVFIMLILSKYRPCPSSVRVVRVHLTHTRPPIVPATLAPDKQPPNVHANRAEATIAPASRPIVLTVPTCHELCIALLWREMLLTPPIHRLPLSSPSGRAADMPWFPCHSPQPSACIQLVPIRTRHGLSGERSNDSDGDEQDCGEFHVVIFELSGEKHVMEMKRCDWFDSEVISVKWWGWSGVLGSETNGMDAFT